MNVRLLPTPHGERQPTGIDIDHYQVDCDEATPSCRHVSRHSSLALLGVAPSCCPLQHGSPRFLIVRLDENGMRAACPLLVRLLG
jgi:hypothetical protein